ncbi:thioesterase family protein [Halobacillus amylolyticus]|uniref:Thioesterase family protein n=1 Tax=Halobacillus amylolyticus TaxID=2932259 RepID=A0ABY4H836_9BACI|nr:thioesterase family protein [Halobacillus amylolyticus]UOR10957.1 thioesterase family protein [Halobacillus amylolyticus]
MPESAFNYQDHVHKEWVDYNGHMNDAAYAAIFSHAVDYFMDYIGLDEKARESFAYTIFTLETHLCYLKEAHENEKIHVSVQLIDDDAKRLHIFFVMKNNHGDTLATSEQMLMGMSTAEGRPASFPESVSQMIKQIRQAHEHLETPKQVGRQIGIKR